MINLIKKGFESINLKFNKIKEEQFNYLETIQDFYSFNKKINSKLIVNKNIVSFIKGDINYSYIKHEYGSNLYKDSLSYETYFQENYEINIYYFYEFISKVLNSSDIFYLEKKSLTNNDNYTLYFKNFDENTKKLKETSILFFNINFNEKTEEKIGYLRVSFLGKLEEVFNYLLKEEKIKINLYDEYVYMLKNIKNKCVTRIDYFYDFNTEQHIFNLKDDFKIYGYKSVRIDSGGEDVGNESFVSDTATYYYISNLNKGYKDAKNNKNVLCRLYNKFEDNLKKGKSFLYSYNNNNLRRFEIETQSNFHSKFKDRQKINENISVFDYIGVVIKTVLNMREENNKKDADYKYKLPFLLTNDEKYEWKKRENVRIVENKSIRKMKLMKKIIKMIDSDEIKEHDIAYLFNKVEQEKNLLKQDIKNINKKIREKTTKLKQKKLFLKKI